MVVSTLFTKDVSELFRRTFLETAVVRGDTAFRACEWPCAKVDDPPDGFLGYEELERGCPPVCGQPCAAIARRYYAQPALWLRSAPLPPSPYPPVCGQLCAAIGRRFYAQLALGLLLIAGRIRQTAAELIPARLLPTVCNLSQQYAPA